MNSLTLRMEEHLMSMEEEMKKVDQLSSGRDMEKTTRNGRFFTLIKLSQFQLRVLMKNSDGIETDHSTLLPDFQARELLRHKAITISHSRNGLRTELLNNGGSTQFLRPLGTSTGRTTPWKSQAMVEPMILESQVQSIQDGGRCSEGKVISL